MAFDIKNIKISLPFGKRKKTKKSAGLDIGSYSIKLAVSSFDKKTGTLKLHKVGKKLLPPGAIVDKEIRDREGLIYVIQTLVDETDPDISDVVISLAGHKVFTDKLEIPEPTKGKRDELMREAVLIEAEQRIPTGTSGVSIDFVELGKSPDGKKNTVMLVAARSELIEEYTSVVADAGLTPIAIELDSITLFNIFEHNYDIPTENCVALVNIGHWLMNVTYIVNGSFLGIRDISNAARGVWERLQVELRASADDINQMMLGTLSLPEGSATKKAVYNAIEDIGIGLGMAFQYLENVTGGTKIEKVYISGGGTLIPYLVETLSTRIGTPCELLDPFARLSLVPETALGDTPLQIAKQIYPISLGLALRGGREEI